LTGSDPHDPLAIDPAILDDDRDMAVLVASTKQAREIGRASVLVDGWGARELYPGPGIGDDDLEDYIRKTVTTYHHQVGTCRMGVDELAVVDPTLRVRGMSGLWVIDASIIPTITSGNTNAPAAMIAERGAQFILNARR
jgi:choline dehydrogenase